MPFASERRCCARRWLAKCRAAQTGPHAARLLLGGLPRKGWGFTCPSYPNSERADVPGYDTSVWFGVCAPKNTPAEIIDKLNTEINLGLANSKMRIGLAIWAALRFEAPRSNLDDSSPTKRKSGAK